MTYSTTGLVQHILKEAVGSSKSVQGPAYWRTAAGLSLVELASGLPDSGSVPSETHLRELSDEMRPVFENLDEQLLKLGPDVTRRSKVLGFTYYVQRKLCDVRIHAHHLSVLVRDLDPSVDGRTAIIVGRTQRYAHAKITNAAEVDELVTLVHDVYVRQGDRPAAP